MRRKVFVSLLAMLGLASGPAYGDVTYSYVAEFPSYTAATGTPVSVKLYLQEAITTSGSDQTSLINRYFAQRFANPYTGVSSIGVAVHETSATDSVNRSQIQGPVVVTPPGTGYNGVSDNSGWTFAREFEYSFQQNGTGMTGSSSGAVLYQNINDSTTTINGNNIQVKAALSPTGSNGATGRNIQTGVLTDGVYTFGTNTYASGRVLIGTLNIQVGNGVTTFEVRPLSRSTLTYSGTATFNGVTYNPGSGTTSLSGSTVDTLLSVDKTVFPLSPTNTAISLDVSYTAASTQRGGSATYDTYNSINNLNAVSGPDATPTSSSFLPFYSADPAVYQFTVAAVPEPGSMALCGLAVLVGAGVEYRRRWKRRTPVG